MALRRTDIEQRLEKSWSKESSANSHWSLNNKALGQCAVSALIVQDMLGGKLMRTIGPDGSSHYFNVLIDGVRYDTTAGQFNKPVDYDPAEERTREYVLSFPDTVKRYQILKDAFNSSH